MYALLPDLLNSLHIAPTSAGDVEGGPRRGRCHGLLEHGSWDAAQRLLPSRNLYGFGVSDYEILMYPGQKVRQAFGWALFTLPPQNIPRVRV